MTQVPGQPNKWQITLTPRSYYGLNTGDVVYWIPAVFRNANGSIKGTGTPGPIESGLIHTTQDFFLRNQLIVGTDDALPAGLDFQLYPNPAKGSVQVLDLTGRPLHTNACNSMALPTSNTPSNWVVCPPVCTWCA
jgi:hypothetical protein